MREYQRLFEELNAYQPVVLNDQSCNFAADVHSARLEFCMFRCCQIVLGGRLSPERGTSR